MQSASYDILFVREDYSYNSSSKISKHSLSDGCIELKQHYKGKKTMLFIESKFVGG